MQDLKNILDVSFCRIYVFQYFNSVRCQSLKWCFLINRGSQFKTEGQKITIFLCCRFKKYVPTPRSQRFSPMLLYRSCIVLLFTFRFTSHLDLIFCVGSRSLILFFPYGYSTDSTLLIEKIIYTLLHKLLVLSEVKIP